MKYAILSDVHANPDALSRVLADAQHCHAEQIICLGDVVGYGPLPAEAIRLLRAKATLTLAGNHDDAVSRRGTSATFNSLAAAAVTRHRAALSPTDLNWLKALPYTCALEGAVAAHGDLVDPAKFYYVDDLEGAAANFNVTEAQLLFVGHTHEPAIALVGDSGQVYLTGPQDFTLEPNKRYIVNPGSVGYPREVDGTCRSSYVLYDSEEKTIVFRFLPFSVASVMPRGSGPAQPARPKPLAVLLAGLGLTILLSGLAALLILRTHETADDAPRTAEAEEAGNPHLVLHAHELTLKPTDRKVRANLRVKDAPVELTIEYRNARAERVGDIYRRTVKGSDRTPQTIPAGALAALFTLRRATTNDRPRILSFAPAADAR